MSTCYTYDTSYGPLHILRVDRHWTAFYEGAQMGQFDTAEMAASKLSVGGMSLPFGCADVKDLAISADLSRWRSAAVRMSRSN